MPRPMEIEPEDRAAELVRLWNAAAGEAFPLDERLFLQQLRLDTDPRRCLVGADGEGRIIAAAMFKRAARPGAAGAVPETGYLSFLAVDPAHRRRGLASALLEEGAAWLRSLGASALRFGGDHYHLLPGRPLADGPGFEALEAFLRARGFLGEGVEYDLVCDIASLPCAQVAIASLDPSPRPPSPLSERPADGNAGRYAYRPFRPSEREAFLDFMRRQFPGRWSHEAAEAIGGGMLPRDLIVAVDTSDGAIVGFSRIYDEASAILGPGVYWRALMGRRPGGLGPIGVDASRRGAGLGLGLLSYCVRELRSRGVSTMVIDWTDLLDFYGKLGFKVWKRYEPMSAAL